jgi:hypothetical protein
MLIEGLLGTLTGILGNAVGAFFKYKNAKLDIEKLKMKQDHEVKMVQAQTQAMIMEAKANIKVTQAQVEGAIEIEDSKAFLEAQKQGNKNLFDNKWVDGLLKVEGWWKILTLPLASIISVMFGLVDFIRGLVRPALTIYLCGVTSYITYMAWEIMNMQGVALTAIQASTIFHDVTSIILYLTVSCVTFWFGDRQMSKSIMKLKGVEDNINKEIKI